MVNDFEYIKTLMKTDKRLEKPLVIAAPMGAGKTTIIKQKSLELAEDGIGGIIVVERKDDGKELVKHISVA